MPVNFNKVMIAGNLTRDPEIRFFANERAVASMSIAINRKWRDRDGNQQEETTYVDVEAWGRTAELAGQYLTKGRGCLVEGRLKLDQWEDKDGNKRSKLKVVADTIQFLDSPGGRQTTGSQPANDQAPPAQQPAPHAHAASMDDEPPF